MNLKERKKLPTEQRIRYEIRLKSSLLPLTYNFAKLEDFNIELHYINKSLFVHGVSGVGKTHLLVALLKRQLSLSLDKIIPPSIAYCRYISFPELLDYLKNVWNNILMDCELDTYLNSYWLYIDDFNVIENKPWIYNVVYKIINYRWNNNLPLIIASNNNLNHIENILGDGISRRIAEMGAVVELSL